MLKKNGVFWDEIENIINFVRNIEDVEVAVIFIEEEDKIKVSLRFKYYFDCV